LQGGSPVLRTFGGSRHTFTFEAATAYSGIDLIKDFRPPCTGSAIYKGLEDWHYRTAHHTGQGTPRLVRWGYSRVSGAGNVSSVSGVKKV